MGVKSYFRHSKAVTNSPLWPALRLETLRCDDWQCVQCSSRHRLQVDHVKPVRTHWHLRFEISNLQVLCGRCHGAKTRVEIGLPELSPERREWRDFVKDEQKKRNMHA
jgi:5-methylcytosine-specific restriction endonuclease McrA